jgi:hypothetical protein
MTRPARGGLLVGHLLLLAVGACAANGASPLDDGASARVGRARRPLGMPIGTGAAGGALERGEGAPTTVAALDTPPAEVTAGREASAPPALAAATTAAAVPCAGCLELQVDVDDINQRDEFAFMTDGGPITRVVWTLRVNFNSDQLAVQPFVDTERGKYTALHVNTFPLGQPVEVVQDFKGKGRSVGLVVGSSGAWTGNQTMSVFIDSVSVEGLHGSTRSFATDAEGIAPRTSTRNPKIVIHPETGGDSGEPPK